MNDRPTFTEAEERWLEEVKSRWKPLTPDELAIVRRAWRKADESLADKAAARQAAEAS